MLAHLRVAYNAVIAAAARARDAQRATDLFAEMRRADLQPDRYTYNAVLRAVATMRKLEDAQRVYRGMQAGGIPADEHTVAALVAAHTRAGQLEQAAQLLERTTATDPKGRHYTVAYNTLLEAWARKGDPERAMLVFQQMRAHHVAPDDCTYLALFKAFHTSRLGAAHTPRDDDGDDDGGEAAERAAQAEAEWAQREAAQLLRLEEDMRARGVQHSVQTQTALAEALGPASLGLLTERVAQAREAGPRSAAAAPLDAAFFTVAIGVCTAAMQLLPAMTLWADMLALGVRPDVTTYNAAINCCAELRELDHGLRLADQALRKGLRLDASTLASVIKLCCFAGQYRAALPLLFRAEAIGAPSGLVGYNLLLRAASMARDTGTLERLLERMKRRRIKPDGDTCLAVVRAYVAKGNPYVAAEALDALTARMFGHGGATAEAHADAVPPAAGARAQTVEGPPQMRDTPEEQRAECAPSGREGRSTPWGPQEAAQRELHVAIGAAPTAEEEAAAAAAAEAEAADWEFVADSLDVEQEDATTAEVTRAAMLYPSTKARNQFLARMVGVSGGGFEGAAPAWEARAAALREIDWNGWARRLRQQYDARKAARLRRQDDVQEMPT